MPATRFSYENLVERRLWRIWEGVEVRRKWPAECEAPRKVLPLAGMRSFVAAERLLGKNLHGSVDPRRIEHALNDGREYERSNSIRLRNFICGGDWHSTTMPLGDHDDYREMTALMKIDADFRGTEVHAAMLCKLDREGPFTRNGFLMCTPDDVDHVCEYRIALAESVRCHGLLPREEFLALSTGHDVPDRLHSVPEDDVMIAVGANGELLSIRSGKHRLAIAHALELARMPVMVRLVHVAWLNARCADTGLCPKDALISAIASGFAN